MLIFLCLILGCLAESRPEGNGRKYSAIRWGTEEDLHVDLISNEKAQSSRNEKRQLSDPDILNILRDLLSEERDDERLYGTLDSKDSRKIRRLLAAYRKSKTQEEEKQLPRQGRQELREAKQFQEGCETTGYETQIREDCATVSDTECNNVTVTRFRKEIDRQCTTRIDQTCRPTKTEIPHQKCTPRYEKRCEHHYQTVEEKHYKEQCQEEIKYVCEEHVNVPYVNVEVPYPVKVPYPVYEYPAKTPNHRYADPALHDHHNQQPLTVGPTLTYPRHPKSYQPLPIENPVHNNPNLATPEPLFFNGDEKSRSPDDVHNPHPHAHVPQYTKPLVTGTLQHNRPHSSKFLFPTRIPFTRTHPHPLDTSRASLVNQLNKQPTRRRRESEPSAGTDSATNHHFDSQVFRDLFLQISDSDGSQISMDTTVKRESQNILGGSLMPGSMGPDSLGGRVSLNPSDVSKTRPLAIKGQEFLFSENEKGVSKLNPDSDKTEDEGLLNSQFSNITMTSGQNLLEDTERLERKDETFEEKVRQAMLEVLQEIPSLGAAFDNVKFDQEDISNFTDVITGNISNERIVHATLVHDHPIHHLNTEGNNNHHPSQEDEHLYDHLDKPVPTVTIVELPAEPGCRSFSTKTCHKIPIVVPKKVPYEECRNVPAVDCFFVLKTVDDIECSPTSYEDCTDTAVEVPYLDQEEQCEDIEYEDCVDVEEQVPIQVCKVVDRQRKPIINREIAGTENRKGERRTGVVSRPVRGRG